MIFARELFYTHSPIIFERHKIWRDDQGKRWRMTKIKRVGATRLFNGGAAPCWAIYGKRVSR